MCGIAGFYGAGPLWHSDGAHDNLTKMTHAIAHRGPDGFGHWRDDDANIALGHRRLSIVDLSNAGAQPMTSHNGRYVISFNGEIYNFLELKKEIEAKYQPKWRGHSDTEVLLEYVVQFGLEPLLAKVDGMFAFALYDKQARNLTLARDPFGEKPLYYGYVAGSLAFASETKSFLALKAFKPQKDFSALANYFKYNYIPAPQSIYKDIRKLPAANYVVFTPGCIATQKMPAPSPYWSARDAALTARPLDISMSEAVEHLEGLLKQSLSRRMISDVPLGVLLSGGIDSSLVTALMQSISDKPIKSFSIGFDIAGFNEADIAKSTSEHLGTNHTSLILNPKNVMDAIPNIAKKYDEPFADSSQVPTFLVSQMARRDVTVAMSGDGADELFGGYNRYFYGQNLWDKIGQYPTPLRRFGGKVLANTPMALIEALVGILPREFKAGRASEKVQKMARVLQSRSAIDFHDQFLATNEDLPFIGDLKARNIAHDNAFNDHSSRALSFAQRAMVVDVENYMVDDVLVKVDRASMAVALEARTPYLNRALFDFAWSLPLEHKISKSQGKHVMRELLYKHVPESLINRPKSGFAIPIGRWMKTDLKDWVESKISDLETDADFILDIKDVKSRWEAHKAGRRDHEAFLWSVIMYQDWQKSHIKSGHV